MSALNPISLPLVPVIAPAYSLKYTTIGPRLATPWSPMQGPSHCVLFSRTLPIHVRQLSRLIDCRYLLNGNILAARTFLGAFISYVSPSGGTALPIGNTGDEITFTHDSLLNFAQLSVRSIQRAAGAQNRTAREAWIRLRGTYQSRAALLAQPEIRMVREIFTLIRSTDIDTEFCRYWTNWERCILILLPHARRTPIHSVT